MKPTDRPTKNDNGTANSTKDADSEGVGNEQALSQSPKRSPIAATNHENPLPLIIDAGLPPEARNHGDTDGNVPPVYHSSGDGLEVIGNTNEIVDSKQIDNLNGAESRVQSGACADGGGQVGESGTPTPDTDRGGGRGFSRTASDESVLMNQPPGEKMNISPAAGNKKSSLSGQQTVSFDLDQLEALAERGLKVPHIARMHVPPYSDKTLHARMSEPDSPEHPNLVKLAVERGWAKKADALIGQLDAQGKKHFVPPIAALKWKHLGGYDEESKKAGLQVGNITINFEESVMLNSDQELEDARSQGLTIKHHDDGTRHAIFVGSGDHSQQDAIDISPDDLPGK